MEEKRESDKAQCAAVISRVRDVSGLAGRYFAHSTLKDRYLNPVAIRKIIRKLIIKRSTCLAKFFTI